MDNLFKKGSGLLPPNLVIQRASLAEPWLIRRAKSQEVEAEHLPALGRQFWSDAAPMPARSPETVEQYKSRAIVGPQNAPMASPLLVFATTTGLPEPSPFVVETPGAGFGLRAPWLGRLECIGRHSSGHSGSSLSRRVCLSGIGIGVFSSGFAAFPGLFSAVGPSSTPARAGATPLARPHGRLWDP